MAPTRGQLESIETSLRDMSDHLRRMAIVLRDAAEGVAKLTATMEPIADRWAHSRVKRPNWLDTPSVPASILGPVDPALDILELELSVRLCNALQKAGIVTVGQFRELTRPKLLQIQNIGERSANEAEWVQGQLRKIDEEAVTLAKSAAELTKISDADEDEGRVPSDDDPDLDPDRYKKELAAFKARQEAKRGDK